MIRSRPFSRAHFPALLNFVRQNAKDRWPAMTHLMSSDLAWQFPGSDPKDNIRLWFEEDHLIGYGWFQPTSAFHFDTRVSTGFDPALAAAILDWGEEMRGRFEPGTLPWLSHTSMQDWADAIINPAPLTDTTQRELAVSAFEGDSEATAFLQNRGYQASPHFEPFLVHNLEVPEYTTASDLTIRAVQEGEFEELVATHRAAWAPSSGFDLGRYERIRAMTDVFDPDLSLVADLGNGTFAGCTIFWADPVSRVGSIEPFGIRPEYRGQGVSKALIYEGLRRLKARGMEHGRVYTAGFNQQAYRLYQSCGYKTVDRSRTYTKTL